MTSRYFNQLSAERRNLQERKVHVDGQREQMEQKLLQSVETFSGDFTIAVLDAALVMSRKKAQKAMLAYDGNQCGLKAFRLIQSLVHFRVNYGVEAYEALCTEIIMRKGLMPLIMGEAEAA